jgi:hypothetical protein
MSHRRCVRLVAGGLMAWAVVASAGLAAAQEKKQADAEKTVLGGPAVNDAGLPGQKRSFSAAGKSRKDRMEERGTPPRIFIQALGVIRGDQVGEGARLTAGQDEMIRVIHEDFQATMRAYREAHHQEVAALRDKLSPESRAKFDERTRAAGFGGGGDLERRPGKGKGKDAAKKGEKADEMMDAPAKGKGKGAAGSEGDEAIKQRLVEIMEGAPKPKDAQAKVMSVLNEPQKSLVGAEIERLRKESEEKRPKAAAGAAGADLSGLPEGARERLKNMTPEQREQAVKRFQERRAQRQGGEAKPAPSADEANVPKPDSDAQPPKRKKN